MDRTDIRQIGRYKLIGIIGQGGMGIVYHAVDESIDRPVAIKMLLNIHAEDKDLLARFDREVRSTASLQHKNIVTVYDVDDYQGTPYMVMEYLEGQSLSEMIKSRHQTHLVEKLGLISQVCEGLQYAHQRGVIHRDIKPANILVLKDGTAKIVDFGIARAGRNESITRTGQIVGSVHYMSPEQIRGGAVDRRTDIYSTGVTLYQLLTGEVPFKSTANHPQDPFLRILNEPLPSLSKRLSSFPPHLDQIIRTATAKEADARYQTAEDFAYELARLQENLKDEMITDFLSQASSDVEKEDFESARQKLQEILKLDRRHSAANELFQLVREKIQQQQRSIQVVNLRSQAEIALSGAQYEEALDCIERACRLEPKNEELAALSSSIKEQVARAREIAEVLRRGQASLFAGDLKEAGLAVQRALDLDANHTEARALDGLVRKEIEERARRARLQKFVDQARQEIATRDYLSAIASLQEAQSIDPQDSDIRELLNWAQRGHEQETLRSALRRAIDEIGGLIRENRYGDALALCDEALKRFPGDTSLEKLRELAQRQHETAKTRRVIEETCVEARRLVDEDRSDEAIHVLERALEVFPQDLNLKTLLSLTISENERRVQEKEERERKLQDLSAEQKLAEAAARLPDEVLTLLSHLQERMRENRPIHDLRTLAEELRSFQVGSKEPSVVLTLSEFDQRLAKRERDFAELKGIAQTAQKSRSLVELDSLADRARSFCDRHRDDREIGDSYKAILSIIAGLRAERETVSSKSLEILRSMQDCQDLEKLKTLLGKVQELTALWREDPQIRSFVNQASAYVEEIRERKKSVLRELDQFMGTLSTVRSNGQIRSIEERARMLSAEYNDFDVTRVLQSLGATAKIRQGQFDKSSSRLRELNEQIESARTMSEIDRCETEVRGLIGSDSLSEEDLSFSRNIERRCAEVRKEHERTQAALRPIQEQPPTGLGRRDGPAEPFWGGKEKGAFGDWPAAHNAQSPRMHESIPSAEIQPVSGDMNLSDLRSGGAAAGLSTELLLVVEQRLAALIGPVAKVLVRKAAAKTTDIEELYTILAAKLTSERDRKAFLAKRTEPASRGAGATSSPAAPAQSVSATALPISSEPSDEITPAAVEHAGQILTQYLGPIAKVLARKDAKRAATLRDLYELLAEHVPDPAERQRFLSMAGIKSNTKS